MARIFIVLFEPLEERKAELETLAERNNNFHLIFAAAGSESGSFNFRVSAGLDGNGIECYGYRIAAKSLLFWEMCQHMDSPGFRLIDIVDIMHRPSDQTFWQCDAFFVPKTLKKFENNSYQ